MKSDNNQQITDNRNLKFRVIHFLIILLFITCYLLSSFRPTFAADSDKGIGCGGGLGPIAEFFCGLSADKKTATEQVGDQTNKVMSGIIGFLTVMAGLWFGLQMILGGYDWINSAGDKGKLETARNKIVYAIIGFGVVVAAYIIIGLIGTLLGLKNLLNPGQLLIDIMSS